MNLPPILVHLLTTTILVLSIAIIGRIVWSRRFDGCKASSHPRLANGLRPIRLEVTSEVTLSYLYGALLHQGYRMLDPEECKLAFRALRTKAGPEWDNVISKQGDRFCRVMLRTHVDVQQISSNAEIRDSLVFATKS